MKISKIVLDEKRTKYHLTVAYVRQIADILETSIKFEEGVIKIRKNININNEGVCFQLKKHGIEKLLTVKQMEYLMEETEKLTSDVSLQKYWMFSIANFILYNELLIPKRQPISIDYPDTRFPPVDRYCSIKISEPLSKITLFKYIDKSWPRLESAMKRLAQFKLHNMKRSELAKRIVMLRDEKKLSFKEISEFFAEEDLPIEEYDILNENYVKVLYHRWKKKSKSLSNSANEEQL
jgi:hypothetical protein